LGGASRFGLFITLKMISEVPDNMNDLTLIETYKRFLQAYSPEQLRYKPEQAVWSIGQMYDHLLVVAHEYLDSAEACALAGGEQTQGKTEFGEYLFNIGGFPPIKIQLPPELNAPPDNTKPKRILDMSSINLWHE
jgi:DinB superfamily